MADYKRGSEWRRWDLHIHTPFTRKKDNFIALADPPRLVEEQARNKWDGFFKSVLDYVGDMSDPLRAVHAIGITDYFSIENYKKVVENTDISNRIPLILPNIELRILPAATEAPINLHCIFDPSLSTDIIENRFLSKLKYIYGNTPYSATNSSLINLGKTIDSTIVSDFAAEKKALEQYVVNLTDLQELFNNDEELRERTVILISNKSTDGASGVGNSATVSDVSDLTSLREELYKFADAIFSGNPRDRLYFLGKKPGVSVDDVKRKCGKLMSCLHGSDAHKNDDLFEPDLTRYCWIKADPTFNGLKQIIYEPEERVCISETKPQVKSSYQVIESMTINHDDFQREPIVFNDKLNCIIGGKSTGKSILLHNLARAISLKQVEEKCEITSVKTKGEKKNNPVTLELDLSDISVRWLDDDETTERKIVYIPQTYLNRLADSSEETTEIDNIIERIVLERKDANGDSLLEAKVKLLEKIDMLKSDNTHKLLEMIRRYEQIKQSDEQIAELGGKVHVEKEIKKMRSERDELSQAMNLSEEDVKSFDEAVSNIDHQIKAIDQVEKEILKITEATTVVQYNNVFFDLSDETLSDIQITIDNIISTANDAWNLQKSEVLSKLEGNKAANIISRDSSIDIRDRLKDTIESNNAIKEYANRLTAESEKLKDIEKLEARIKEEQNKYAALLEEVSASIVNIRHDYELFAQYINDNTPDEDSNLSYYVQIVFMQEDFVAKWIETYGVLNKSREIVDADKFTSESYSVSLIKSIIEKTLKGELKPLKSFSQTEQALRNVLDDWYNIKYVVKMENDTIEKMSPGKKALVLLKLLIELADSDCPILIDQPEDDLDNRSVYDLLIEFVRDRKVKRQIIVVTHNANIVLSADAEEVIVANQEVIDSEKKARRFEYRSGSIENDSPLYKPDGITIEDGVLNKRGIQQHICDILEGGITAFEKRKNKYHSALKTL